MTTASLPVQPHLYIGDAAGRPLDNGKIFFGEPNKDPEFYPINIYYDQDMTIPAMQPVRSKGGFMNANGDMVEIYAEESEYSVKVLDAHGVKVFYKPSMVKGIVDSLSTIAPTFYSVADAKKQRIFGFINFLRTITFNGAKGGALYARSTALEVEPHSPLAWFQTADGAYWLLDEANPTPEMFGAKGDLKWQLVKKGDMTGVNIDTCGPRMLSGTNDIEAFNAAMKYAKLRDCEKVAANGDYYIRSYNRLAANGSNKTFAIEFDYDDPSDIVVHTYDAEGDKDLVNPTSGQRADAQHKVYLPTEYTISGNTVILNEAPKVGLQVEICQVFSVVGKLEISGTLWTHYALPSQGVYSKAEDSRYIANLTIGQYSYNGYKPSNNGQFGTILCGGSGFLLNKDHDLVQNVLFKSQLIRAARILTDTANGISFQDSDPSQMCVGIGNIRNMHFMVDPYDAETNVASLMLCLLHWGGRYTPPGGAEAPDKGAYPIEKSWHPEFCSLTVTKPLLNSQHGFFKGFELASTINCVVSDVTMDGLTHPYWVGVGDVGGAYAQGSQKGRVNTGNNLGYITAKNINIGSEFYGCLFKGEGTSKFEKYEGTDLFLQRQEMMDLTVKGHNITTNGTGDEVIRMRGVRGNVDMGVCYLYGCPRCFYILSGTGKIKIDIAGSDGVLRAQNFKGLTLLRTNIDLGNESNSTKSGLYEKGYESKNCTVYLQGTISTTTTTAAVAVGATTLPIAAFTGSFDIISPGDTIKIKSGANIMEVQATGFVVKGALNIPITPIPKPAAAGATVTMENIVEADYINMTSKSSEYGLYTENAVIKKLDFSQMGWSGRHAAKMHNTKATIIGRLPSSDARRLGTTSDQGIWADSKCRLVGMNLEVPKGSDGDEAVFLQYSGGEGATLTMIGGVIEDINTFSPTANQPINQITLVGTVDKTGKLVSSPGRSGSNANGYWAKHSDGTMECWVRNIQLGSTKPYVWTFPQPFIDTGSTFVNCTPTSVTDSRVGSGLSISATQAHVWLNKNDATATDATAVAGMSLYAKGFWK